MSHRLKLLPILLSISIAVVSAGFANAASGAQIKGVLMDRKCSSQADFHVAPGPQLEGGMLVAEAHTRECALMPQCQKSGYGVYTEDNKFLAFDATGNHLAREALKASAKIDDLEVEVNGEIQGDTIKVKSLKLL